MIRDLDRLARDHFDLLVIGGGIYGLAAADDAARRGLSVALIERHDLGSGTSFNHHKTLHGGLRYLQTLDVRRMRESIRERRAFAQIAGPLVQPQPFVMPTTSSPTRGRAAMRAAFLLDRMIAADRNSGVPSSHLLPPGRVLDRDELARLVPGASLERATGGALWYDYVTVDSERLTLSFAVDASRHGASIANYVDAIAAVHEAGRVTGMQVRDAVTGESFPIRARVTLNATGAGAARVMGMFGARRVFPLIKAMNVVTRRPAGDVALACPTADGRLLVALPWRGRLAIGTSHGADLCGADHTIVKESEVSSFLAEINSAFPWLSLTLDDVTLVHRGVVPAKVAAGRPPALLDHAEVRDHRADGVPGAVSVIGVKYTTARAVARRAVDLACRQLGRTTECHPSIESFTHGETRLGRLYGPEGNAVLTLAAGRPELAATLPGEVHVTGAEVVHAIRSELALSLEDVVIRRTGLGAAGHPGHAVVSACAAIMAKELGWSAERVSDETAGVDHFYDIGRSGSRDNADTRPGASNPASRFSH